jgi:DNA-binding transcriptional regulator YiaG
MRTAFSEQNKEKLELQKQLLDIKKQLKTLSERRTILGTNLYYYRQKLGLDQVSMADLLGIGRPTLSNWETGVGFPTIAGLLRVCETLKCTPNDLLLEHKEEI